MKSLIEYIEDLSTEQSNLNKEQIEHSKNIKELFTKQVEITQKLEELEIQQSQVIVNQEYANCLLELNS